ncbi:hypothetical protein [Chryseobacterium indoltheticum]|uniref:hypothetical protein n=1 Tax=Chryseobacterium indoltheticum TaxID=254 RepID=UPI003F491693
MYENIKIIKKAEPKKVVSKKHDKNPLILDLHFENLVKNPHDYDSFERLFLQKEKLIQTINFCRRNHLKKLEIVHGIGDGTLQEWFLMFLKAKQVWIFTIRKYFIINRVR